MGILTSTKRTQPTGGPRSAYDDDFAGPATLARRMRLLLPTDQRKVYWDWLVVVSVLWNVFMIPFSFGFGLDLGGRAPATRPSTSSTSSSSSTW